ncbi:regulator of G-protein signaling 21 [Salvelinus sp. IW2-2015]|uniref:regulator of G-protein signaling 21 n=1 Tax=Salvelinus sp. IW2-2015 TaxID=2691554 RepID=UPI000CDF7CA0|nr:regulator of G-protein signaling 21 [Salvelinus alpinus]
MPILVTSPSRELHSHNMDMDDKRRKQTKGSDFKSRLQRRSSQSPNTERLSPEEIILWSQSLERLLASKYGMTTFQAFLKSEFSDENIEFWLICEDYKKIKSSFRLSSRAKKIYKTYIEAEAPKEINIDHKTRDLIRWNVKTPTTVCFDEAQRIVYRLMEKDSYPRFLRSNIYRTLLDSASDYIKV